jgi:MFS family permease
MWSWTGSCISAPLCLSDLTIATQGAILQAGVLPVSQSLGVSFTQVTLLAGYVLLSAGAFGIFVSGLARKFGKRPMYIFCSLMAVIGCIIGECATTYETLVAARVVQGFGVGAYESIIVASIGDLFYVHERGPRVAVVMFLLSTVTNGILVIAGPITANLGWHYNFHILMPFVGLQFLLTVFFVPETTYLRKKMYEIDETGSDQDLAALGQDEERHRRGNETLTKTESRHTETISQITIPPKRKRYLQRLAIYNGIFVRDSIIKMFLAPLAILLNLGALYNVLVSGITLAWFVAVSIVSTIIFSSPPYLLTPAGIGYTSVAPMIGGVVGSIFMGLFAKSQLIWLVKRNGGIYEPEFQLLGSAVGSVTSIAGMVGFGYAAQNFQSIYVICFCWGLMMFGLCIIAISTSAYVLDAYRQHSTELFIMNMLFKNFFFYG